jgi:hypothetical protein
VPAVEEVCVVTHDLRMNPQVLERELAEVPGIDLRRRPETDFSLENLKTRLYQVYRRGDFERMDNQMIDQEGMRTVEVQGVEKSWGTNKLFLLGAKTLARHTWPGATSPAMKRPMPFTFCLEGHNKNDHQGEKHYLHTIQKISEPVG